MCQNLIFIFSLFISELIPRLKLVLRDPHRFSHQVPKENPLPSGMMSSSILQELRKSRAGSYTTHLGTSSARSSQMAILKMLNTTVAEEGEVKVEGVVTVGVVVGVAGVVPGEFIEFRLCCLHVFFLFCIV